MIPFDQRRFLSDLGVVDRNPRLEGVFHRNGWDIVTNGHALLRLRGESPSTEPPREPPPVDSVIDQPRPNSRATTMEALCAWAVLGGPYRCHCAYCASPHALWETDRIEFGGVEINRALLWHYLKPLPRAGVLRVSWGDPRSAVLVAHADWELYVMCLAAPDAKYTAPFAFDDEHAAEACK